MEDTRVQYFFAKYLQGGGVDYGTVVLFLHLGDFARRDWSGAAHTLSMNGLPREAYMVKTTGGMWKSFVRMQVR